MAQQLRDIMTPDPVVLDAESPLADAAQRMRDEDIGDVLVRNGGRICGLVTDRDITIRAVAEGRDPGTTRLDDVCSHELISLTPQDSIEDAARLMRDNAIRRVPVLENDQPVGMVSLGDLSIERDSGSVLAEISAAPPSE
jgi:CBS domain-containing protein